MLETASSRLNSGLARFRDNEKAEGVASDPCRTLIIANCGAFRTDTTTDFEQFDQTILPSSVADQLSSLQRIFRAIAAKNRAIFVRDLNPFSLTHGWRGSILAAAGPCVMALVCRRNQRQSPSPVIVAMAFGSVKGFVLDAGSSCRLQNKSRSGYTGSDARR